MYCANGRKSVSIYRIFCFGITELGFNCKVSSIYESVRGKAGGYASSTVNLNSNRSFAKCCPKGFGKIFAELTPVATFLISQSSSRPAYELSSTYWRTRSCPKNCQQMVTKSAMWFLMNTTPKTSGIVENWKGTTVNFSKQKGDHWSK